MKENGMSTDNTPSLFERLGGQAGIEKLMGNFYQRILADPTLAPFFAQTSMEKLRRMQSEFFAAALGGPQKYSGRSIAEAHHNRGIERQHFTAFCEHLFQTLEEIGVSHEDINQTVARISLQSRDVTGNQNVDG
jgi:hemoglobin